MRERTRTNSGLPPNARAEILETLCANMEISSDEIVAILKRHHVAEDTGVLQDRYRRQLGQRLMAGKVRVRIRVLERLKARLMPEKWRKAG